MLSAPTLVSLLLLAASTSVNASPVPVVRSDSQPCWTTYVSLPGDTCDSIAMAFRITSTDVYDANTYLNCRDIWVGTPICVYGKSQVTLTIPPVQPTTLPNGATCWTNYRAQLYDTCDKIADRFGITPADVYNANTFLDCSNIWENTPISICVGDGTRTRTTVITTPSYPTAVLPTLTAPISCWEYRSVQGDTCQSIGARFGLDEMEIYNANNFLNCQDIWVSTPVQICTRPNPTPTIPTPTSTASQACWTIRSQDGDTCDTIAERFFISSADVYNHNTFLDCSNVWPNTPVEICSTTVRPLCFTVQSLEGDTCDTLGSRFGVSRYDIYNENSFLDCNSVWTNTPIKVCKPYIPSVTLTYPDSLAGPRPTIMPAIDDDLSVIFGSTTTSSEAQTSSSTISSSSSSSDAEYVAPTSSSSSSSEAEYVVPTEYIIPSSSLSSSSSSSSSSSETLAEYVAPTEYIAPTTV